MEQVEAEKWLIEIFELIFRVEDDEQSIEILISQLKRCLRMMSWTPQGESVLPIATISRQISGQDQIPGKVCLAILEVVREKFLLELTK